MLLQLEEDIRLLQLQQQGPLRQFFEAHRNLLRKGKFHISSVKQKQSLLLTI